MDTIQSASSLKHQAKARVKRQPSSAPSPLAGEAPLLTIVSPQTTNTANKPSGQRFYDPGLDVVRFIASALVVFQHIVSLWLTANPHTWLSESPMWLAQMLRSYAIGGGLGVVYFYALSAFLLCKLFLLEQDNTGKVDLSKFWVRRCLRIWPLYFCYLGSIAGLKFLTSALTALPGGSKINSLPSGWESSLLPGGWKTGSLFLFVYNWFGWLPGTPKSLATILWSVCLEEQFYALLIVVILILGVKRLPKVAVGFVICGLISRTVILSLNLPYPAVWLLTPSHLDVFGVGILAAWFSHYGVKLSGRWTRSSIIAQIYHSILAFRLKPLPPWIKASIAVLPIASPLVLAFCFPVTIYSGYPALFTYFWSAVMAMVLVFCLGSAARSPHSSHGPLYTAMVFLGRRAYGIYVYHWFVLAVCPVLMHGGKTNMFTIADVLAVIAGTVIVTVLSYRFIEKPFLRWKIRFQVVDSTPGT